MLLLLLAFPWFFPATHGNIVCGMRAGWRLVQPRLMGWKNNDNPISKRSESEEWQRKRISFTLLLLIRGGNREWVSEARETGNGKRWKTVVDVWISFYFLGLQEGGEGGTTTISEQNRERWYFLYVCQERRRWREEGGIGKLRHWGVACDMSWVRVFMFSFRTHDKSHLKELLAKKKKLRSKMLLPLVILSANWKKIYFRMETEKASERTSNFRI